METDSNFSFLFGGADKEMNIPALSCVKQYDLKRLKNSSFFNSLSVGYRFSNQHFLSDKLTFRQKEEEEEEEEGSITAIASSSSSVITTHNVQQIMTR